MTASPIFLLNLLDTLEPFPAYLYFTRFGELLLRDQSSCFFRLEISINLIHWPTAYHEYSL